MNARFSVISEMRGECWGNLASRTVIPCHDGTGGRWLSKRSPSRLDDIGILFSFPLSVLGILELSLKKHGTTRQLQSTLELADAKHVTRPSARVGTSLLRIGDVGDVGESDAGSAAGHARIDPVQMDVQPRFFDSIGTLCKQ